MGKIEIDIDLQKLAGGDIRDKIVDGIESAADMRSADGIGTDIKEAAQANIRNAGAIRITGQLITSFEVIPSKEGNRWRVRIINTAEHAPPIEFGAEFGAKGPPIAALIPWVALKGRGFDVPEEEVEELPDVDTIRADSQQVEFGPDVTQIADDELVKQAFAVQQYIKENGIDALRYMERAQLEIEPQADDIVSRHIRRQF